MTFCKKSNSLIAFLFRVRNFLLHTLYFMKYLLVLFFIVLIFVQDSFSQPKKTTSFRDYFIVNMNPDSLEKEVYTRKNEPDRYLHELLRLEYSRYKISDHFGNDLSSIQRLLARKPSGIGTAMYHYILGLRYKSEDAPRALGYFQQALSYFERTKDTSGLAHCHLALVRLNTDNFNDSIGDTKGAKYYFDKTVELVEKSSDERDRISLLPRYLADRDLFYEEMPLTEVEKEFRKIIQLVRKYPEMTFMLKDIYLNLSYFYLINQKYTKAIETLNLSLKNASHCSPYNRVTIYSNLASANEGLEDYDEMEKLLEKIIATPFPKIHFHEYVYIEANFGLALAAIQTKKLDRIMPYLIEYDGLNRARADRLKTRDLLNLQTKYETEKKQATINTLNLEKQLIEDRNRLIIGSLLVALLLLAIVSFLAIRLRSTNRALQTITRSRDKLFTVIAHDLRSPINTYQGLSDTLGYLIKSQQVDRIQTVARQIDQTGQNLSHLLTNLFEWSRSQLGQIQPRLQSIDVSSWLNGFLPVYKDSALVKGVELETRIAENMTLVSDPDMLSAIVRNLLDNAIKHCERGKPVIFLMDTTAQHTRIIIQNTVSHFSEGKLLDLQQHLSGQKPLIYGEDNTGLGLLLIKEFADSLQTSVQVSYVDGLLAFEIHI
ncbi:HAMP domain-containing histidine kinase [Arundinibacter roseus]|uniref:histidine kinase n=2 Tax=Arundinibacter roseus TaxID=2070510 RepID=A0A4V2XAF3_9BACT|nr:HAMP domain-containing histidine kinase [Arundinibacter roseus]